MCALVRTSSIAEIVSSLFAVSKMVSYGLVRFVPAQSQIGEATRKRGLRTLIVPGDGGLTSSVAKAGALVSPALISPPSPLDRLRARGLSLLFGPERGDNLSAPERSGKASVAGIANGRVKRPPGTSQYVIEAIGRAIQS